MPSIASQAAAYLSGYNSGARRSPTSGWERAVAARLLTKTQLETISLVATGCNNREIGSRLGYSENTIKSRLAVISEALGAQSRAHIVAIAFRAGVLR